MTRNPIAITDGPYHPQRRDVIRPSLSSAEVRREFYRSMKRRGITPPEQPYARTEAPIYTRPDGSTRPKHRTLGQLTEEEKEAVIRMYETHTAEEVAEKFGVRAKAVRDLYRENRGKSPGKYQCRCGRSKSRNAKLCFSCSRLQLAAKLETPWRDR